MFQQRVYDILDAFKVNSSIDYYQLPPGEKPYFTKRLFKAFIKNKNEAVKKIPNSGGVNLHFQTSIQGKDNVLNVPTEAFLKKLCFYSNNTLITFPFRKIEQDITLLLRKGISSTELRKSQKGKMLFGEINTSRTPVGGKVRLIGEGYSINSRAFDHFLSVVTTLRPAVESGFTYLFPTFPDQKRELSGVNRQTTSANFSLPELQRQFSEAPLGDGTFFRFRGDILNLYLPHFTDVPLKRVLEIRNQHSVLYSDFQKCFEGLLKSVSEDQTEIVILNFLKTVDEGIRELNREFISIQSSYSRKNVNMGIGILCTGLAMYVGAQYGQELAALIATATGGATGMQYLSGRADHNGRIDRIRTHKFYVPWTIYKSQVEIGGG